ncbi:META domain-containing protein [Streptomyces sp. NBC_00237]|uniref:META domain-containing protein n=1 Tax=Streptomyces sp. NBC_00237 TaxID=2975687 RepID=UPI00225A2B83|nr:META domain-containing protein [Streptomyces sp. NBC_00237]MCX5205003.1 META domain-containing protein [Streptomyces sp. NBC_00237]
MRRHNPSRLLLTLLTSLLAVTACSSPEAGGKGGEEGKDGADPAQSAALPAPRKPQSKHETALAGTRWKIQWVTVGGKNIAAPDQAGAWVEFTPEGTALGNYGCVPFEVGTTFSGESLTLDKAEKEYSSSSLCPDKPRTFEEKLRKIFTGPLTLKYRHDAYTLDLTNPDGDYVAIKLIRPKNLFGHRWQLQHLLVSDTQGPTYAAGKEIYFVFHENGTVSGKLGCNDFSGRATFQGETLTLFRTALTTQRTCSAQIMSDEKDLLSVTKTARAFTYRVTHESLTAYDETQPNVFGYEFQALPDKPEQPPPGP